MSEFCLPSLGADMDEGTIVEWMVQPGDRVARGDIVALVETEKGVIEVEVWHDGVVSELVVPEGTKVAVGAVIARFSPAGEPAGGDEDSRQDEAMPAGVAAAPVSRVTPPIRHLAHRLEVDVDTIGATGPGGTITREDVHRAALVPVAGRAPSRARVSPYARKRAEELGVDLTQLTRAAGERPVHAADVEATMSSGPPRSRETSVGAAPSAASPPEVESASEKAARQAAAMRHAIAQVMARSKREIPHYYLGTTIDMETALAWLAHYNAERPVAERVLPAVLLLKAAALAVAEVPEMNGLFVDGEFRQSTAVHLGVAISLRRGGLIAPAIHDAETRPLDELMAALRDLVARTRSGRLRGSEMADPTITITNLGDRGVETVFPVIYAPQVAIVGFGKVVEQPIATGGMLGIRPTVHATLAADHRVSDGHRGGLYLAAIDRRLQKPEEL